MDSSGTENRTAELAVLTPEVRKLPRRRTPTVLSLALLLAAVPFAMAQPRPYIGFVYPAGGQQGTTFQVRLGGQNLDDPNAVLVTSPGVTARVVEYNRRLNNQEQQLLTEQLRELRKSPAKVSGGGDTMMASDTMMMSAAERRHTPAGGRTAGAPSNLIARLEKRTREFVQTPACDSIASILIAEVSIAPDAEPGGRELRVVTARGVSNPLAFHVGQLPEFTRKPMLTAPKQILGKEEQALRKRPASEVVERVTLPCTVNGQIASGEVNRYRFEARQGQRLVLATQARQLVPYIADAVPGWFQPVLTLYDASGKELAFADDYRFRPDPVILFEAPRDGDYVCAITDAIYRGREDFVYRLTLGELPFVTSVFPLGGPADAPGNPLVKGWNLDRASLRARPAPASDGVARGIPAGEAGRPEPIVTTLVAVRDGLISNPIPFAHDSLPEAVEKEPNDAPARAQKVTLPVILNGLVDRAEDWDVFQFSGRADDLVVAEVQARRLESPLDSVLKLTDASGRVLALNDDCEDLATGLNTHHADSHLLARLPADGVYFVHLGAIDRRGGEEYGYRLRLSPPQPDFALRVVPSSVSLRSRGTATVSVFALRKDACTNAIKLTLLDPPRGFSAAPVTLAGTQAVVRLTLKTDLVSSQESVSLKIAGTARVDGRELVRVAVPAEDRMQAFLWRHLVSASELRAVVFDPNYQRPPKRLARARPPVPADAKPASTATNAVADKPKFSKQQVAGRLRQLKALFEEGLLTDEFYDARVAECEAAR